jgi:nucleoside permease NupC
MISSRRSSPFGLAIMAPEGRSDVISLGFKSIVGGTLTTCLMGTIVEALI